MIGVFFAEGFEEVEALTVVDILRRASLDVKMISINSDTIVNGSHGIKVTMDDVMENVDFDTLDSLVLPGGKLGFANLEKCEELKNKVCTFIDKPEKMVAAICGAPSVLGHWGILEGKKATVYPGMDSELTGAKVSHKKVVTDGNLITSRGMGTAIDFSLAIVTYYKGMGCAKEIAKSIVF